MKIQKITEYHSSMEAPINELISQLTGEERTVSPQHIKNVLSDSNSHLFMAIDDGGCYRGMITVGIYLSPTGKKAWIEDVVVDESFRGKGLGERLNQFAIEFAKEQNVEQLMLYSNPTRIGANKLYQKLGFKQRVTNVYRMLL